MLGAWFLGGGLVGCAVGFLSGKVWGAEFPLGGVAAPARVWGGWAVGNVGKAAGDGIGE